MGKDGPSLPQGPRCRGSLQNLNFVRRRKDIQLKSLDHARNNLDPIYRQIDAYSSLLDDEESLALYMDERLSTREVEAQIRKTFNRHAPLLSEADNGVFKEAIGIGWIDVARKAKLSQFETRTEGGYQIYVRDQLIQVSETEMEEILSFPMWLVEVWPGDVEKENEVTAEVISHVEQLVDACRNEATSTQSDTKRELPMPTYTPTLSGLPPSQPEKDVQDGVGDSPGIRPSVTVDLTQS
ncbi:uncharacterized protein N7482_000237 [Penicillium canariense]|uniref:Uncharacterized protein n=1 Tax=Penicillium canariense TaxID=189055 RepID=A0A9W9IBG8_9EURO|nr:uncharacterized protein N7482_000237 [Penicillium canariense]KAJ5174360.1 hypothetical protein N7482_000237 [Penicillium canariense]